MTAAVGVVVFPGSNCEHDVAEAVAHLGGEPRLVWHADRDLGPVDAVVLPGGFAHGDYLRPGAIARFSPVMSAVEEFARSGGPVVGICNGFQVLTEAHLLPGALQKNSGLTFLCQSCELIVASEESVLTEGVPCGTRLSIPINHFEGNYTCDERTLAELEATGRVVLRYAENPNGSVGAIAGVANDRGNVVGLMPHPERATLPASGSTDGAVLLSALLKSALGRARV
ncbi:MAG TPA: phosphoribosylformylglycinamidine synthase subunit PurQ [Acidimicrobiales bacterium]|nr:phosphoribosylformylglycinamidine synthase subunit PurQ [Acidimicrobiales bacterium]